MLVSLFEVYDSFTFWGGLSLNWGLLVFIYFNLFLYYWIVPGISHLFINLITIFVSGEFGGFFGVLKSSFGLLAFVSLLFYIFLVNLLGLVPYVFACSAHFVFSLSLGLPFWLGFMFMGWFNFVNHMFSHLIPCGTPFVLISFMVIIETVSNFIRPWALSIRLMANMISGHLLMSLLGDCGVFSLFFQLGLFGFEFFVCFIQAYVFSALLTMYSGEI